MHKDHNKAVEATELYGIRAWGIRAWGIRAWGIRAWGIRAWETRVFGIRSRQVVGSWVLVLGVLSAAALLLPACPAYAQAGDIDTCGAGGNVGGEGGQALLNAIKNLALFGAAAIGGLSVLGLLASGAAIILGSASKDWQRRGAAGLGYAFLGIVIALGAAAIYGVFEWAICG